MSDNFEYYKKIQTMYSIYRELHPPTSIENALECYFFNKKEKNLVITSVNELFIYRIFYENDESKMQLGIFKLPIR